MIGIPARSTLVDAGQYAKDFVPYGTPCEEVHESGTQKLETLRAEVESLRRRLIELADERDGAKADAKKRDRA
jgi:serine O-acetyltransferase